MSTEVKDIVESFNIAKFIPQYADEARHPFFEPYKAEIEDFSRVRRMLSPRFGVLRMLTTSTESVIDCKQGLYSVFHHP